METPTFYTAGILTLGCKVNQYESHAMEEALMHAGVTVRPFEECCDLYIINTCTVTGESDRKSRQMIRRARSRNPDAIIAVTGCGVQKDPQAIAAIEGVDLVCGNRAKLDTVRLSLSLLANGKKPSSPLIVCDSLADAPFEEMSIHSFDRVRAYIKIQDGCSGQCAYCIIAQMRGPVRSKAPDDVLREAAALADAGCHEIVLTGIETSAYQYDLADLLTRLDAVEGVERIRLSSLDPAAMKPAFIDRVAALSAFAPHFHVSLQSGCNRTLAAMRRRYTAETASRHMAYIRHVLPRAHFSADIITGFPGESEADFSETLDFVRQARLLHAHIFPYSRRPGTPAASMPDQIPESVKAERSARLSAMQKEIRYSLLEEELAAAIDAPVLIEEYKNGMAFGHSDHFMEYAVPADRISPDQIGRIVMLHPLTQDGNLVIGTPRHLRGEDTRVD